MSRIYSRENAFRTIYSKLYNVEFDGIEASNDLDGKYNEEFYSLLVDNFNNHYEEIKNIVSSNLKGITIERVYKIDLALIYLAITELNYTDSPKKVVINEVIELAKKYSTEKSSKFINGFLANLVK
ncbi:MAG: transcription antitermination factor NusB [Clostridia bacterium]|nr:transcription antitermination factor NusB [Clostridia bacterium]